MTVLRRLLPITACIGAVSTAALLPAAATAVPPQASVPDRVAAPAPSGAHAAVTWNGWRGVHFGDTTRSAHRALGGSYYRGTNAPGGCGDILTLRTGTIDSKVGPRAHRVSDFDVAASVAYPLGIRSTMGLPRIERLLEAAGYSVKTHRVDLTGGGTYAEESFSVGPHGHTLYVLTFPNSGKVGRMGLALNHATAKQLLEINGC